MKEHPFPKAIGDIYYPDEQDNINKKTELKTLKDLYEDSRTRFNIPNNAVCLNQTSFFKEDLRQEAIKWIKEYEDMKLPEAIPEEVREYGKGMTIDFIKHFFGIEESELE